MPTMSGMLGALSEIGVTKASLDLAVGTNPLVRGEVIRMAHKAAETWQQIWDEQSPHPYQTGAYRGSFTVTFDTSPTGYFSATVRTTRPNAHWLEYGTSKMREFAPARKTIDRLNGEVSGHTSQKQGGGFTGHVGG